MEQRRTVQQQHAAIRPIGTRKLRESCISCSRSKVKCDKQKPTCGRCFRRGLPCEFMVSRRTGRTRVIGVEKPPSSTARAAQAQPTTYQPPAGLLASPIATSYGGITSGQAQARCSADSCSGLHHCLPATSPRTPANTLRSSPHCTHLLSPPDDTDLWTSILSPDASNTSHISSLWSLGTDMAQLDALSPSNLNDLDTMSCEVPFNGSEMLSLTDPLFTSLMEGMETSDSVLNTASLMQTQSCCFVTCLDLLRGLFPNAHAGCEQSSQVGLTKVCTIESVIEDNKQTLETLQAVLECQCADDEYVVSLVCLIVIRVLGWYIAVARDPPRYPQDKAFSSTSSEGSDLDSRRPSVSTSEEQVLNLPPLIGSCFVDSLQQSRMAAQLVLGELYRVQQVVSLVGSRLEHTGHQFIGDDFCGSTSQLSSSLLDSSGRERPMAGTATPSLSSSTLSHLEEDVRNRLRAVASGIIDILRQG
ncbi:aflatoxin regulatory protein-domain-containing protein [Aspergillus pseudodeflectus]|uniref:Aflatoxin regulatory protein-domain-containing protein n=1 Tax=Aspergillus pseudodeflectus TaxID=176178 RepID=A0ABR4KWS6_9EURO